MDDMVFQYNNQNSIYVLNASYNSYGDFGRLNLIACPQLGPLAGGDRGPGCQPQSVSRTLQHKLRTLGSCGGPRHASAAPSTSSAAPPPSPGGSCSPAAAAIQKLFNCTSLGVTSSHDLVASSGNNSNNNNGLSGSIMRDCLSATETDGGAMDAASMLGNGSGNGNGNGSNNNSSNSGHNNKKKCTTVKSTLIAKKTKFWKYLEEERQRTQDNLENIENLPTSNCERNRDRGICFPNFVLRANSSASDSAAPARASATDGSATGCRKTLTGATTAVSQQQQQNEEQEEFPRQYKSSNWSGNHDSNNQMQPKTSSELYREAAELLGLSCTLCDNCRCLDCQSGYFDCDDSDSYSEFSLVDEYDECPLALAAATATTAAPPADEDFEPEGEDGDNDNDDDDDGDDADYPDHDGSSAVFGKGERGRGLPIRHHVDCGPQCSETSCNSVGGGDMAPAPTAIVAATAATVRANDGRSDVRRMVGDDSHSHSGIGSGSITTQPLLSTAPPVRPQSVAEARRWLHELESGASFNELSLLEVGRGQATGAEQAQ